MGYATKDLMLMEEVQESSKSICDAYNFPPHLLGLLDPTFNNQAAAEKGLYQNSIIPDAENIYTHYQAAFGLTDLGLRIEKDYAHLPILQDDKKTLADARRALNQALLIEWQNGLITLNEWRIKNGEDPLPDGRGELYFDEYKAKYLPEPKRLQIEESWKKK